MLVTRYHGCTKDKNTVSHTQDRRLEHLSVRKNVLALVYAPTTPTSPCQEHVVMQYIRRTITVFSDSKLTRSPDNRLMCHYEANHIYLFLQTIVKKHRHYTIRRSTTLAEASHLKHVPVSPLTRALPTQVHNKYATLYIFP